MPDGVLVLAPLWIESAVLPKRSDWTVIRSGMGPARARIAAARGVAVDAPAVAIVGLCGAVSPELRAGDVVCATEVHRADAAPVAVQSLAALVRPLGLRAVEGPILSTDRVVRSEERRAFDGVAAVDMESAWLAEAANGRPLAVLRVVVEEAQRDLVDVRTPAAGLRALRNMRRACAVLDEWATAAPRRDTDAYLAAVKA